MRTGLAAVLVGLIWGATNPYVKRGAQQISSPSGQDKNWYCWLNPKLCIPWLINQSGSAVFVLLLGQADISTAVPVANAVSIAANAVVSVCDYHVHGFQPFQARVFAC